MVKIVLFNKVKHTTELALLAEDANETEKSVVARSLAFARILNNSQMFKDAFPTIQVFHMDEKIWGNS